MFRRATLEFQGRAQRVIPPVADGVRLDGMFRAHHELVWRTLRRRGLAPDAAADVVQQAFVVAAERLDDIHLGSERAFLVGTALRLARSAWRGTQRMQLQEDMDIHPDLGPDIAEARSAIDLLDLVLHKIDSTLVDVFVLFELEGFSSPEIAGMLDLPLGTVASRLRRAREAFRAAANRIELVLRREERGR
jgi:RNA polymerase sigma-70 factor (ECF subfamily)